MWSNVAKRTSVRRSLTYYDHVPLIKKLGLSNIVMIQCLVLFSVVSVLFATSVSLKLFLTSFKHGTLTRTPDQTVITITAFNQFCPIELMEEVPKSVYFQVSCFKTDMSLHQRKLSATRPTSDSTGQS